MRQNRSVLLIAFLAVTAVTCACALGDGVGPGEDIATAGQPTPTVVLGESELPAQQPATAPSPVPGGATAERPSPTPLPASGGGEPLAEGEITIEQRTVHLDALADFRAALSGDDPEADRQALVDYMITAPEFEDAGLGEDGSVWGRFTDGRLVIFPVQPPGTDEGPGIASPPRTQAKMAAAPFRRWLGPLNHQALDVAFLPPAPLLAGFQAGNPEASSQGGELPESKHAVVVSMVTALDAGEFRVIDMLMDKGYQVQSFPPYVEALKKQVQGVGVFYFNTHGGVAYTADERKLYGLASKEPRTPQGDATHREDLEADRLAYAFVSEGDKTGCYYAITQGFISKYMRFSKHSFVYSGACSGYNNTMHAAFASAGASVYAGWTAPIGPPCATEAYWTLFDLLLGTNDYYLEDPPFRPFDYRSVWQHLQETGWDTCHGGRLMFKELVPDDDFALLAPSIKNMEVDEGTKMPAFKEVGDGELTLHGVFGSNPGDDGRVTLNERPLEIRSWEKNKIVVRLPKATDPDGAGKVVVTVRGHDSNEAPLTRWQATFDYAAEVSGDACTDPNDQYQDFAFDVVIRADVHPYREKPGDTPLEPESVPFSVANTSKADWIFSGACRCCEWTARDGTVHYILDEWGGMGDWAVYTAGNTSGFQIYGQIDARKGTMTATLWSIGATGDFWNKRGASLTTTITSAGGDPIVQQAYDFLIPLYLASPITLQLGEEYDLEGSALSLEPYKNVGDTIYGTLEWDEAPAEFPPAEDTPS